MWRWWSTLSTPQSPARPRARWGGAATSARGAVPTEPRAAGGAGPRPPLPTARIIRKSARLSGAGGRPAPVPRCRPPSVSLLSLQETGVAERFPSSQDIHNCIEDMQLPAKAAAFA